MQLAFDHPPYCKLVEQTVRDNATHIAIRIYIGEQATGRLELTIEPITTDRPPAYFAAQHRATLAKKSIEVGGAVLIPAFLPERFEAAWYCSPLAYHNGIPIDAPLLIYLTNTHNIAISMIGPTEATPTVWEHNQAAFATIRDSVQIADELIT